MAALQIELLYMFYFSLIYLVWLESWVKLNFAGCCIDRHC